ncbi:putative hormone-sensitive lipase [Danaus plexippus plexippus]|uniref:Hormone-sensitive lipase n=2 Tax=Danaus plexippus plexippus TaxID=278856 RepID=A0A212F9F9_DANPL|nr:putative hormone-sensitive lipase [Danaus plexippus plexippus]
MEFAEPPAKASLCCEDTPEGSPPTYAMYEALKESCQNNASYFQPDDSENGQRLYQGFMTLIDHIDTVWPLVDHVRKVAPLYDFDAKSPGNGYRSFVSVVDSCVLNGLKLSRQVCTGRDALLFRKGYFVKEVESNGQLLASLGTCLHHLQTLLSWAPPGELFPTEPHSPEELFSQADTINQYCFYGRCLGFQFLPSMRNILKGISICMAGFSEAYYSHGNLISSMWTGGQYLIDPEMRARRIVNISQSASVEFCKAFWFLAESEIMRRVPSLMSSTVAVNKLITIPPEPLAVTTKDGKQLTVLPPEVHIGLQGLNVRLISVNKRMGMSDESSSNLPPAEGVVFHCHGGGFVAQSSKSHETYLREWAAKLNMPILSVDYSLAPQAPFPRALEEVYYAYCWLLNNFKLIGTTGKRIVFAGDSAGANLIAGCTLKILSSGLRTPEGLFMAYAPLLVSFIPSPARLLCLMDPLLPFGFMMRCLKAYASPNTKGKDEKHPNKVNTPSNATSPVEGNGFLRVSPSQGKRIVFAGDSAGANLIAGCTLKILSSGLRTPEGLFMAYAPLLVSFIPSPARLLCLMDPLLPFGFMMRCLKAYASPNTKGKDEKHPNKVNTPSNATSPVEGNGFLRVSPSQEGISSGPSSFEEVSPSDLAELQAHKSGSERRQSADTTISGGSLLSEHTATGISPTEDKSQQYVSDFLDKYVFNSDTDSEGRKLSVVKANKKLQRDTESESTLVGEPPLIQDQEHRDKKRIKARISEAATGLMGAMSSRLAYITGSNNIRPTQEELSVRSNLDALIARSPSDEFIFSVPRDPLLSPYWADDDLLKRFPPVRLLTVHLDPCLDDCVMFAKKLKGLGNEVGIDVLEGLPHGFLNFSLMAKEANEGSKLCVERIKQLLDLENPTTPENNHL